MDSSDKIYQFHKFYTRILKSLFYVFFPYHARQKLIFQLLTVFLISGLTAKESAMTADSFW